MAAADDANDRDGGEGAAGEGEGGRDARDKRTAGEQRRERRDRSRARGAPAAGDRGERSQQNQQVAELGRQLRSLPPEALAALGVSLASRGHQAGGPTTPKMSTALSQLDADNADNMILALEEAAEEKDEKAAREIVREADADVAEAIRTNAEYRKISWRQSAANARAWLVQRYGDENGTDERRAG